MIVRIEKEAVRRILRNKEDCALVVGQLERECGSSVVSDDSIHQLARFGNPPEKTVCF